MSPVPSLLVVSGSNFIDFKNLTTNVCSLYKKLSYSQIVPEIRILFYSLAGPSWHSVENTKCGIFRENSTLLFPRRVSGPGPSSE